MESSEHLGMARARWLASVDPRLLALGVFAGALAIRVVYLLDIRDNPFFLVPVIDAEFYHQMAQAVATTGLGRAPYQMPPGWPLLLSLLYRLTGPSLVAAHVLQIVFGAASAAIVFAIGRRMGGTWVGLAAGVLVATSKALLFLEGDLLAAPLGILLDVAAILFLVRWAQDGQRWRDLGVAALALGLSGITWPLVFITVPVLAGWMAWRCRRVAAAALFVALAVVPVVPVAYRNWQASGELVLVSANGGINFWMGNNPDWRRTSNLRPGPEWRAMQELPLREAGIVDSSERDRWFLRSALGDWARRPLAAVGRTFEKTLLLVHNHEIMRDFDLYYFRDRFSWVLRFPGWNFALLLGFAVAGLAFARARVPGEGVLLLFLASNALVIVLFFVVSRYRAPLVPVLAVFAAQGLVWLVARGRAHDWKRVGRGVPVVAAVFTISSIDFLDVDHIDVAEAEYRIATTYEKSGRLQEAILRYDEVLEKNPDHPMAAARAAVCTQLLGHAQEAVDRYERILDRHPGYAEIAVNLANLGVQHGNRDMAEHYFKEALSIDPYLSQAHASYALFLLQEGDARAAVEAFGKALEYDPAWEALRVDYARALLASGDLPGARREIERAKSILPSADRVELVRGDVYAAEGRDPEARAAWESGLRLNPGNQELRARLAAGGEASGVRSPVPSNP